MINNAKELYKFIDILLHKEGFTKKKDTWYLNTEECISFFSIGKDWGGYFSHLMGCFLKELKPDLEEFPKYNLKDLGYGLEQIVGKEIPKRVFNLSNNEFTNDEREALITNLFETYIIPFLKEIGTKEGIKNATLKYPKLKYFLVPELQKAISIFIED